MKNLLSFDGFVNENFSEKGEIQTEIPTKKEVVNYNLDNLCEVELIEEKAIPAEDLMNPSDQIGLMQKRKTNEKSILLYDFDDSRILGYTNIKKFGNDPYFELQRAAAEKNYGPIIYDFALMSAYPNGIAPSPNIKPAALKLWYYYMTLRGDVSKKPMPKDDRRVSIDTDLKELGMKEEEALEVINTLFFLKPSEEYNEIMKRGEEEYTPKYNTDKNMLVKKAEKYFWNRYNNG